MDKVVVKKREWGVASREWGSKFEQQPYSPFPTPYSLGNATIADTEFV
jgi:hypothetical protein